MKVILLSSVPKVGAVNEVVEVSDGYAQNFLIPQRLAKTATEKNIEELSRQVEINKVRDEERKQQIGETLERADGSTIEITRDANEVGTLFSSISAGDISEALEVNTGVAMDESYILLDAPIKKIGEHQIDLAIGDTKTSITLNVQGNTNK